MACNLPLLLPTGGRRCPLLPLLAQVIVKAGGGLSEERPFAADSLAFHCVVTILFLGWDFGKLAMRLLFPFWCVFGHNQAKITSSLTTIKIWLEKSCSRSKTWKQ